MLQKDLKCGLFLPFYQVVADLVSRNKVKKLIENTLDAGGEA